jgi:hypothetical protein
MPALSLTGAAKELFERVRIAHAIEVQRSSSSLNSLEGRWGSRGVWCLFFAGHYVCFLQRFDFKGPTACYHWPRICKLGRCYLSIAFRVMVFGALFEQS